MTNQRGGNQQVSETAEPGGKRGRGEIALRIMATTDLHMHILPFDYVNGTPSLTTGLARTAGLIRTARAEATNALLFDNGDFLHGSPLGDEILRTFAREQHGPRGRHPIVAAMARLGYDAMTLGNHDFDHGIDHLAQVLATAPFPVVSSNLSIMPEGAMAGLGPAPVAVPFALLDRELTDAAGAVHPFKLGVLGFLPPGTMNGLRGSRFRAKVGDIVGTAKMMVPLLRGLGADLVIALAHSGIAAEDDAKGLENAVVPLAAVPGLDAIVAGHAHQVFPDGGVGDTAWPAPVDPVAGRVHGVPVVSAGFWGSHLGIIDLSIARAPGSGRWAVRDARVEARPISRRDPASGEVLAEVEPDPAILKMLERLHRTTLRKTSETVGRSDRRLHSYFAAVAPSPALDVVHRAMLWYTRRLVAGTPLAELPLVASTAPFKAGGLAGPGFYVDILPGKISRTALADLYLYPNDLVALRLTGAALVEWMERAASVFNRIAPGQADQELIAPETPVYEFETLAGIDCEIDLSQPARYAQDGTLVDPAAHRVRDVRLSGSVSEDLAGAVLAPEQEVLLLTNSFRATGGGGYPVPGPAGVALDPSVGVRDILKEYLAETGVYAADPLANWRFAPLGGARARFLTAPKAPVAAGAEVGPEIEFTDTIDKNGFRVCALRL